MLDFFRDGGVGMYAILLFGFPLVAWSMLYALRPERRQLLLLASLAVATLVSGALGFSAGLMMTFRYIQKVPASDQFTITALGVAESLTNLILALLLLAVSALLVSVGAFRATRVPESLAA
jgi:hypothetical protein